MQEMTLLELGQKNIKEYGEHVILQRAIPDWRDNLKPVHRRILWAMGPGHTNLNLRPGGKFTKVARVVGDTIGKYHPHGEVSAFEALVKMAKSNQFTHNLIDGEGNFGNYNERPAAQRYIECRMSKLGWNSLLDQDYLNITGLIPTYDGQGQEPIVLPCLLPLILLNGTYGIAVGSMGSLPPIHPETVTAMMERYFAGKTVDADFILKKLKFKWHYGSNCVSSQEDLKAWITSGSKSLYFEPTHELNKAERTITFTDVPPHFNWDSVVLSLSGERERKRNKKPKFEFVSKYGDYRGKQSKAAGLVTSIVVTLKSSVAPEDFHEKARQVVKLFTNHYTTNSNVTYRRTEDDVAFDKYDIPTLFDKWMRYRIRLEVKMQTYRVEQVDRDIHFQKLVLLAAINKKTVFESLEKDQPVQWLAEKLEIKTEDAKYILDKAIISLARMNQDTVKNKIADLRSKKQDIIKIRDDPNPTVEAAMSKSLGALL